MAEGNAPEYTRIRYEEDVDPATLLERTVTIVGFGSQGCAHALNLRDRGVDVRVGVRDLDSSSARAAQKLNLPTYGVEQAVSGSSLVAVLVPDTVQPDLYRERIQPVIEEEAAVLFAHGFNIRYGAIEPAPTHDVIMVAPKAPGSQVRSTFVEGAGTPALAAVERDVSGTADNLALAYAWGIGAARAGVLDTTFAEECESDLFGEQVVLIGGLTSLIHNAWETLVEAGYSPEVAYFECLHELKLVTDLVYSEGLAGMYEHISATARFGGYTRGERVVGEEARQSMRRLLAEIQDGSFAEEWLAEDVAGRPRYREQQDANVRHPIEEVGQRLRSKMRFLNK